VFSSSLLGHVTLSVRTAGIEWEASWRAELVFRKRQLSDSEMNWYGYGSDRGLF
jgi:hypothetical protein